jgi:hypothetical protein
VRPTRYEERDWRWHERDMERRTDGSSTLSKTSGLPSPSPPAEKTSARQDQAGKSGTGDDCKSLQGQLSRVVTERRSLWL